MPRHETSEHTVNVVAILKCLPGKEASLLDVLHPLVTSTRTEPGCIDYLLHRETANTDTFVFYETWQNQAALDAHMTMPHFTAFVAATKTLLAAQPDIRVLQQL